MKFFKSIVNGSKWQLGIIKFQHVNGFREVFDFDTWMSAILDFINWKKWKSVGIGCVRFGLCYWWRHNWSDSPKLSHRGTNPKNVQHAVLFYSSNFFEVAICRFSIHFVLLNCLLSCCDLRCGQNKHDFKRFAKLDFGFLAGSGLGPECLWKSTFFRV